MTLKNKKINNLIIIGLIAFSSFILLFVFLMQIVLLNKFYESYKMKQLDTIKENIINRQTLSISDLEDMAYNYGVCISVYSNGMNQTISNIKSVKFIFYALRNRSKRQ